MPFTLFDNILDSDKNETIEKLIEHSSPRREFFLMVVMAISMATFGILMNSTVVLIGSMLIAPVLYSVLSISLGVVISDEKLILRSISTLGKAIIISITISFIISAFFPPNEAVIQQINQTVANRSLLFMSALVAGVAGFAATYSLVRPKLSEALPGVAISTSLIPPLAAVGIGISKLNWNIISSSLLLFTINVVGITLSSLVVFSLLDFYSKKSIVVQAVVKEDNEIKNEENHNYQENS
jgi:uncharacterized hydrophobic protein (TIGR00271 family)